MENELYEICNLLQGYTDKRFKVLKAEQVADGTWDLKVKAITPDAQTAKTEVTND